MATQPCTVCGTENPLGNKFCLTCGTSLAVAPQSSPATQAQAITPAPLPPRQPTRQPQRIGVMGEGGVSAASIWGPFAGYGTRGRHVAWLLDGRASSAEALRDAVTGRFASRRIENATVEERTLVGKGIVVENRPYHLVRRGVVTAGLYIARFGEDLYISQVTYAKGPISWLRVALVGLMLIFQLYMMYGYVNTLTGAMQNMLGGGLFGALGMESAGTGGLGFLACCIGPLGLLNTVALIMAGVHMIFKFFTERDPFMLLRAPLNEFNQDDLVALEKAVEETVRQSLDAVGIERALLPPAGEYGMRERLF